MFRRYITKLIISVSAIMMLGGVTSFSFAQNTTQNFTVEVKPTQQKQNTDFSTKDDVKDDSYDSLYEIVIMINKFLGVFSFPFLWIAAKTLDPSFVYGAPIRLDTYLWQLRQFVRNFANFFIGFLFVLSIIFYFLNFKQDKFSPKRIIPLVLIGVVVVNMSWYLIGLLISLSTALTIGLAAMPMVVLNNLQGDKPVLIPIINLDISKADKIDKQNFKLDILYEGKNEIKYAPCVFVNGVFNETGFNNFISGSKQKVKNIDTNHCVLSWGGRLYIVKTGELANNCKSSEECKKWINKNLKNFEKETESLAAHYKDVFHKYGYILGGFSLLYYQIVDFGILHQDKITADKSNSWYHMLPFLLGKLLMMMVLLLPLMIFGIIMVVRVVFLWFAIIFSPFIFLFQVIDIRFGKFFEKYSVYGVLTLIFMPVFVVLALGLGLIFISVINEAYIQPKTGSAESNNKQSDLNTQEIVLFDNGEKKSVLKLKTDWAISEFKDFIGWLFTNFFGILILWTLVMAALKTSQFTRGFVDRVQRFAENMAMLTPLPTPIGMMSPKAIQQGLGRIQSIPSQIESKQYTESPFYRWTQKVSATLSGQRQQIENRIKNSDLVDLFKSNNWGSGFTPFDYEEILLEKFRNQFGKKYKDLVEALSDPQVVAYFAKNGISLENYLENIVSSHNNTHWQEEMKQQIRKKLLENLNKLKHRLLKEKIYYTKLGDQVFIWKENDPYSIHIFDANTNTTDLRTYIQSLGVSNLDDTVKKILEFNPNAGSGNNT